MYQISGRTVKKLTDFTLQRKFIKSFSTIDILSTRQSDVSEKYKKDIIIRNVDKNQESPLAVIVGWSNSKNKQIAKYSQIFEKQGCTTISVSCKLYRFSMFYDSLFAKDTKACIDALTNQRKLNKDRKVIFQLFSTPGPAMYVNIMNYYHQYIQSHFGTDKYQKTKDEGILNVSGVIYDSPTVASGNAEQFANGMKGNSTNPLSSALFDVLGKIVYAYAVRTSKMHKYGPEFLKKMPVTVPQLMLFSKADTIAGYQPILEFIEYQNSIGAFVKSRMWESSKHVLHYRQHPKEYESAIVSFLDECLKTGDTDLVNLVTNSGL